MDRWKIPVRKLAHYVLFAVGGVLLYFILTCFEIQYRGRIAIFLGLLLACVDELHQIYSLNRGPGILDVAIDTSGVISGVILAFVTIQIFEKIHTRFEKEKIK